MISLDVETHVWCPTCRRKPGQSCRGAATELAIDHDGMTTVHRARVTRADCLADDSPVIRWRRDELEALVLPLARNGALTREGRAPET